MYAREVKDLAKNTYAQSGGNLTRCQGELKAKGHTIPRNTLIRWKQRYNWDKYEEKYREKLSDFTTITLDLDKQILAELIEQKDEVLKAMKNLDKKKQPQAYAQLNFSYLGYVKTILIISGKDSTNIDAVVDEVINALFLDPVTSKVLQSRKGHIVSLLKKGKKK